MSWSVNLSGSKEAAKEAAAAQSDTNIANGYQTEAQKQLVLAAIEAAPGTHVSGSVSGHNNEGGAGGSLSASITSWPQAETAAAGEQQA
jgi:hypothetical protein